MQTVFLEMLKLSLMGSLFALAVMLVRFVFRKAPRWIFCVLWGVVALRLICPVSVESKLSLMPDQFASGQFLTNVGNEYIGGVDILYEGSAGYSNAVDAGRQPVYSDRGYYVITEKDSLKAPATVAEAVFPVLSWVWLLGTVGMLAYIGLSYYTLRRKMAEATHLGENIWQCQSVASPFVLGIFRPRIYLPYSLGEPDLSNVIAHERSHIQRRDHWWKPLGFLLLAVHWFNPVLWAAYMLLCRDIEGACDEKVIRHMEKDAVRAYSTALLNCSIHRRHITACPLAFGEVGVKERIRHVMHYKKPAFWIILLTVLVSAAACVLLLTDPIEAPETVEGVNFPFTLEQIKNIEMYSCKGDPQEAYKKTVTEQGDIRALYEKFRALTMYKKSVEETSQPAITSFRFNLHDGSSYELVYYGYGVKKGRLASQSGGFDYFTSADIGWNWRWLNEELVATPAKIEEVPFYYPASNLSREPEDVLLELVQSIVNNPECAASSNPFDFIAAKKRQYNEILTFGSDAVDFFLRQLKEGENGLQGYIMAAACADITGIGRKDQGAAWGTAQEWLALYKRSEKARILPPVIATDYISGTQARLLSFGYSLETPKASEIACGIAPWQGEYGPENTLVLDGKMGQNLIRLAPQGCSFTHYAIYLPDGTVYDDGTREMYSSLSPMAMNSQEGVCLIAPFQPGEYIYEVELSWPEEGLTVIYGLKVIMTGEESEYDRARNSVFQAYGEGNPQIAVSLVKKFTLANAVYSSPRFVFKVENIPDGPLWVEVSATDGKILGEYKYYDVVVAPSCAGDAPTYFDSGPVETVNGNRKTYYRNTDGTWQVDGRTYQYRLEITGRMHNAAADSTFVYLSNVEEITFDQAWRAAGLSSNSADYFPVEVAVLVEWRTGEKTEVGGVDYPGSVSITPTP